MVCVDDVNKYSVTHKDTNAGDSQSHLNEVFGILDNLFPVTCILRKFKQTAL